MKHEDIYLHNYVTVQELMSGLSNYFRFYNYDRYHQSLGNLTPAGLYPA